MAARDREQTRCDIGGHDRQRGAVRIPHEEPVAPQDWHDVADEDRPGASERVSSEARAVVLDDSSERGRERDVRGLAVGHDRRLDGDAQRCGRRIERHGRPERLAGDCQERRRGRSNAEREVKPDPCRRLAEEERSGRHDVAAVVDPLPDDEPSVFNSVRGIELILLHVPANQRADVGPQVLGQLVGPAVRLGEQVQASGTFEQQMRPGVAGVRCRSQPAHRSTKSARLRIHEPGAHCVPEAVALAARAVEAAPHQVAQPAVELVDARRHLPFSRCDTFGTSFGVDLGCAFRPGGRCGRSTGAAVQPRLHPVRWIGGWCTAVGHEEQQAEGVLAGDLARRAGALVGRAGDVHRHLVRRRTAALTEAPRGHVGPPRRGPTPGARERFSGAGGGGIGRQRPNLFGRQCQQRIPSRAMVAT